MTNTNTNATAVELSDIVEELQERGRWAWGDEDELADLAVEWRDAGFDGVAVGRWLDVRCDEPERARALAEKGVEPGALDAVAEELVDERYEHGLNGRSLSRAEEKREICALLFELVVDRDFGLERATWELSTNTLQIHIKSDAPREIFIAVDGDLPVYECDLMIDGLDARIREIQTPGSNGIAAGAVFLDGTATPKAVAAIELLPWVQSVYCLD